MNERAALKQAATTTVEADRIGFFGKVPSHGDFVSTGLSRGLQDALDQWLQNGLQQLQLCHGRDWETVFRAMPAWRFVIERGVWGAATFAGILRPSTDRVGRSFPLAVIAQLNAYGSDPRALCLDDAWFAAAEGLAETSARRDFDINEMIGGLKRLRTPRAVDALPAPTSRAAGTWWWRLGDDRRLTGFRTNAMPQPEDFIRLFGPPREADRPVDTPPPQESVPSVRLVEDRAEIDARAAEAPTKAKPDAHATSAPVSPPLPSVAAGLLKVDYSDASHPGTRLSLNADCLLAEPRKGLFAVVDGIGENRSAVEAGELGIAALAEVMPQATIEDLVQALKGKLGRAHGLLQAARNASDREPPAASTVVLALHGENFALTWAGDARCYIVRDGMMRCLTRDHVEVGLRRSLSRHLGQSGPLSPETLVDALMPGDRFLLCSQPLCRTLPERSIAEILIATDLDEAAAVLAQEALIANCRDNLSALVVDVGVRHG